MRNSKHGNVTKFITVLVVLQLMIMPLFPLCCEVQTELKSKLNLSQAY